MSKIRIYALAKDLGIESARMLEILDGLGVQYKSSSSTLDEETVEAIKALVADENTTSTQDTQSTDNTQSAQADDAGAAAASANAPATVTESVTSTNTTATPAPAAQPTPTHSATATATSAQDAPATTGVPNRAPVVTIMGHVDHGKTSLLDYIRKTRVAAKEAGGITQHVGAFEAKTSRGKVVFIDTPGHEAFTTIRARGANVADIAIIVVAADDSIMPQTREAIAHAQAAKVPMIVAINKVDLPAANPDKVKQDLIKLNLVPEEFGGDTITVEVSARSGQGVEDLLEMISLVAELEDLRADPKAPFSGVVIESRVDKQMGVLANVMVQQGTLRVGDFLVVGEKYGKIKALTNSVGERIKDAGPSTPVQILGFSEAPAAGETVISAKNEHEAREVVAGRVDVRRDHEAARENRRLSLSDIMGSLEETREINLILRADTQGSLEAIQGILAKKSSDDMNLNVMLAGIGAPTEGDVLLASTAEATIMCFNVTPAGGVQKAAAQKGIEIKTFRIIYELIDEVDRLIKGTQEPVFEERYLGRAEVRMVIRHPKAGLIAGSYVQDGLLRRNARVRVSRGKQVVYEGTITGLKRFKDDVREVQSGYECGVNLDFNDIQEGDVIEASEMVEVTT